MMYDTRLKYHKNVPIELVRQSPRRFSQCSVARAVGCDAVGHGCRALRPPPALKKTATKISSTESQDDNIYIDTTSNWNPIEKVNEKGPSTLGLSDFKRV